MIVYLFIDYIALEFMVIKDIFWALNIRIKANIVIKLVHASLNHYSHSPQF